jgi:DNA polymerase-1
MSINIKGMEITSIPIGRKENRWIKFYRLKSRVSENTVICFRFEHARDKWRTDKSAALDAHRADITGISFSVSEGTAIYVPLKHRSGQNADNQAAIWDYLKLLFESKDVIKVAPLPALL